MTEYTIDLDHEDITYLHSLFPGDPQAAAIEATQQTDHPCLRTRDRIILKAFLATTQPATVDLFAPTIGDINRRYANLSRPYNQDDDVDTDDLLTIRTAIPLLLGACIFMAICYAIIRTIEALQA